MLLSKFRIGKAVIRLNEAETKLIMMKKLKLNLNGMKMLDKEQMRKVVGADYGMIGFCWNCYNVGMGYITYVWAWTESDAQEACRVAEPCSVTHSVWLCPVMF